jgi:hypothetical protein
LFSTGIDQRAALERDQLIIHDAGEQFNDRSMKDTFGQDTAMPIGDFHRVTQTTDQLHVTLEEGHSLISLSRLSATEITHGIEWNIDLSLLFVVFDQSTTNKTLHSICFGDQTVLVNDVVLRVKSQMRSDHA